MNASSDYIKYLNPDSVSVLTDCRLEPEAATTAPGAVIQFERQGYFCRDLDSSIDQPVFNRTIGLRDTWAKIQKNEKHLGG
jgi:glutaminyl-tRNA synthetase